MRAEDKAKPFPGPKRYQQRAAVVLPILVEYALRGDSVSYKSLATRAAIPNPRNLDYVLGSIGTTLKTLSEDIPPITGLVVNEHTGLPGRGGWGFLGVPEPGALSRQEKFDHFESARAEIHTYPDWYGVLVRLSLRPVAGAAAALLDQASQPQRGGESKEHKRLKRWVADNPEALGLIGFDRGDTEHGLSSGDRLDVLFRRAGNWVAVEVKTADAPVAELARGMMQCIKYQAVLEAEGKVIPSRSGVAHRTLLFSGQDLPLAVEGIRLALGVHVVVNKDA